MTSGMQLNLFGFYVLMSISTLKNYENKSLGTLCGTLVSCQLVIAIIIIIIMGFPVGSDGKEFTCNAGDLGLIPVLGRPPGGEHGNPLQYSCLEYPMDGGAWWAAVHGVAKSRTRLSESLV